MFGTVYLKLILFEHFFNHILFHLKNLSQLKMQDPVWSLIQEIHFSPNSFLYIYIYVTNFYQNFIKI